MKGAKASDVARGLGAGKRNVLLTTRGRKSGQPRSVTVWFVSAGQRSIYVQHASRRAAHWYRNLQDEPRVEIDFGGGTLEARAHPITDPTRVRDVLRLIRRKYPLAWLFQLLGWGKRAVAVEITVEIDGGHFPGPEMAGTNPN